MTASKVPFVKLPAPLIRDGYWAKMSAAARTLYPVLLSFSDGNYKDSWPGTKRLLELTGFKQKSSLRKAREELRELGLITYTLGTGRTNTTYHFHAPWGSSHHPPAGHGGAPQANAGVHPTVHPVTGAGEGQGAAGYNQIQISINNNHNISTKKSSLDSEKKDAVQRGGQDFAFLRQRFGDSEVERAKRECELGGMAPSRENLERILYAASSEVSQIEQLYSYLETRVSTGSLHLIQRAFLREEDSLLYFASDLPVHLQHLLLKTGFQVIIEPKLVSKEPEFSLGVRAGVEGSKQRL